MRGHPVLSFFLGLKGFSSSVEEISPHTTHRFLTMPQYIAQVIRTFITNLNLRRLARASTSKDDRNSLFRALWHNHVLRGRRQPGETAASR